LSTFESFETDIKGEIRSIVAGGTSPKNCTNVGLYAGDDDILISSPN